MFRQILLANRGDAGREAGAAKPKRMARAARAGDLVAIEVKYV